MRFETQLESQNLRESIEHWGGLSANSISDNELNRHPFMTLLMVFKMRVLDLTLEASNAENMDELSAVFEEGFVPDPFVPSFRTKSRDRVLRKSERILKIKDLLDKGVPSDISTGEFLNQSDMEE